MDWSIARVRTVRLPAAACQYRNHKMLWSGSGTDRYIWDLSARCGQAAPLLWTSARILWTDRGRVDLVREVGRIRPHPGYEFGCAGGPAAYEE